MEDRRDFAFEAQLEDVKVPLDQVIRPRFAKTKMASDFKLGSIDEGHYFPCIDVMSSMDESCSPSMLTFSIDDEAFSSGRLDFPERALSPESIPSVAESDVSGCSIASPLSSPGGPLSSPTASGFERSLLDDEDEEGGHNDYRGLQYEQHSAVGDNEEIYPYVPSLSVPDYACGPPPWMCVFDLDDHSDSDHDDDPVAPGCQDISGALLPPFVMNWLQAEKPPLSLECEEESDRSDPPCPSTVAVDSTVTDALPADCSRRHSLDFTGNMRLDLPSRRSSTFLYAQPAPSSPTENCSIETIYLSVCCGRFLHRRVALVSVLSSIVTLPHFRATSDLLTRAFLFFIT